jgi:alpha-1,4-digalacturonate transport system substrate-binding protein
MKKASLCTLVLLVTLIIVLMPGALSASSGTTVDVVWFADADIETATFKEIWSDFQKEKGYEEYELNLIEVPYGSLNDKIKTMISGKTPPAMARTTDSKIGDFYNFALEITDQVGGTEAFTSKYAPMLAQYYTYDGRVLAVPMEGTVNGMIYNKDLFDAVGVTVPHTYEEAWTWKEWEENILKVMKSQGTKYGMVWDYSPHRFSTLLYSFGGQIFNEDYSQVIINNEKGVESLEYFKSLVDKGILDPSTWIGNADPNNLFRTGQYPVHMSGSWMVGNYSNLPFEWGVMPFPYDPSSEENHTSLGGGKFLIGFSGTPNDIQKVTKDFLIYVSDVEAQTKWVEATYSLPSNLSVLPQYSKNNDKLKIFAEQFQKINPRTAHDWAYQVVMSPLYNDYKEQIAAVLFGDKTAQEAMDEVKRLAEEIMADL